MLLLERLKQKAVIWLVWGCLMAFSANAFASTRCQEAESVSVYCDDSWRGAKKFLQFLESKRYQIDIAKAFDANHWDKEAVHILLSAPDIAPEVLKTLVADGARMLVFDETDRSLAWFRQEEAHRAFAMASPYDRYAAHINGNPKLPVLEFDRKQLKLRQKAGVLGEGAWHMAFNHPTPIVVSQEDEDRWIYQFSIPSAAPVEALTGWIYIFRDESLPTALMMGTLQNAAILGAVLEGLCLGRRPCHMILYERDATYLPPHQEGDSRIEQWAEHLKAFWDDKVQAVTEFYDSRQKAWEHMPWGFLMLALMALWYVISILISVPLGRDK